MGALTLLAIDSAKPAGKPYKMIDGDGLQLRVAPDGAKTWLVRWLERQITEISIEKLVVATY